MSNLIKNRFYYVVQDPKTIDQRPAHPLFERSAADDPDGMSEEERQELAAARETKASILRDAEEAAEARIRQAAEEAERLKSEARREIDAWWQEARQQDEQHRQTIRDQAAAEGYQAGYADGEAEAKRQYEDIIRQAKEMLEQAYRIKDSIIQEAEPFLVELSTAIAAKIIKQQLTLTPEWMVAMVKDVLARKREKGVVTLCVSPQHFAYIQEARDELAGVLDSQAELQILPDTSVGDEGCVIRTQLGSVDARIDTQLSEIKNALLQLAVTNEGVADDEPAGHQ